MARLRRRPPGDPATDPQPNVGDGYRDHLVDARQRAQSDYDKTVLLLASGATGLTLTFVGDMIGTGPLVSPGRLTAGWLCLVGSLLAVLASFCASRLALGDALRNYDRGTLRPHRGRWMWATEVCNVLAGALLIAGVALVLSFAQSNLERSMAPHENSSQIQTTQGVPGVTQGYTPPPPPPPPRPSGAAGGNGGGR